MVGKRLLDSALGTLFCLLSIPIVALLALGVCVSLRTWRPFFVQDRIGRWGSRIRMIKLRTLPVSWSPYAVKATLVDLRLPRYTAFLRRSHLDELPQLFLVPWGRMSLVGPRPKMPDRFEPVDPEYRSARIQVPQGCTGLWQIGLHSSGPPDAAPQYDAFYLEQVSVRLDLWILWRTSLLILGFGSPVGLADVPRWARRRQPVGASTGSAAVMDGSTMIEGRTT